MAVPSAKSACNAAGSGFGAVEGHPAMLVYDARGAMEKPNHFVLLEWDATGIAHIKDYLYAPYTLDEAEWTRLT